MTSYARTKKGVKRLGGTIFYRLRTILMNWELRYDVGTIVCIICHKPADKASEEVRGEIFSMNGVLV